MTRPASIDALPAGTWSETSRHGHIGAGTLYAQLQRYDGTWVDAQVNLDKPTLANVDGVFVYEEATASVQAHTTGGGAASGSMDAATANAIGASVVAAGGVAAKVIGNYAGSSSSEPAGSSTPPETVSV